MSVAADLKAFGQQCTDFLWATVAWTKGLTGDARTWSTTAQSLGMTVVNDWTLAPLGSVVVWGANRGGAGAVGHVAQIVGFATDATGAPRPIVQEQNWGYSGAGLGNPDTRVLTVDQAAAANYILPPAGATVPTPIDATTYTNTTAHYGQLDLGQTAQTGGTAPRAQIINTLGQLAAGDHGAGLLTSAAGLMVSAIGGALASAAAFIGQAIAGTLRTTAEDVGAFASNHVLPLAVAGVVLAALFA